MAKEAMSEASRPIAFPKEFAADANGAMDRLFDVFPDHYPRLLSEDDRQWVFALDWPRDPLWFVDPNLADAARNAYACSLQDLIEFEEFQQCNNAAFLFSMFHSRALLAACRAAVGHGVRNFTNIVHVDDHDDLMPPLLSGNAPLYDPIGDLRVDLDCESSVRGAIQRGVITKGSFLTAYVLAKPPGLIVHVKAGSRPRESWLRRQSSTLALAGSNYPVSFTQYSDSPVEDSWRISEVPELPLELANDDPVWLDVDLDAFCDRYDGDSSRRDRTATDPEREQMRKGIDDFLSSVQSAAWRSKVKAVSVAASPGFFPSEYWSDAIPTVVSGLHRLICGE